MSGDLLLHSLADFWPLSAELIDAMEAHRVVEIGVGNGEHGRWLRTLLTLEVVSVDPIQPANVQGYSPEVLPSIGPADVYFVDGDHNYQTVVAELDAIHRINGGQALIVIHDIGWPSGRRDAAYDLKRVSDPESYTLTGGVVPDESGAVEGGFESRGQFGWKITEGGPCNGVLTATEDFRRRVPSYVWRSLASIFGLGVLVPRDRAEAICEVMSRFDSPLLDVLEHNRISLYLRVLELQRSLAHERSRNRRRETAARQSR